MELKGYQRHVLGEMKDYIAALPNVKWWHRIKERVPGLFKIGRRG